MNIYYNLNIFILILLILEYYISVISILFIVVLYFSIDKYTILLKKRAYLITTPINNVKSPTNIIVDVNMGKSVLSNLLETIMTISNNGVNDYVNGNFLNNNINIHRSIDNKNTNVDTIINNDVINNNNTELDELKYM